MDGGNADAKFCAMGIDDYIANNLNERIIILQIESPEALANIDEIMAVPGFDMVCFGPADFAHLTGTPGKTSDPGVVAARQQVARVAREHGKFVMAAGSAAQRAELEEEGHGLFTVGADVVGLTDYVRQRVEAFGSARKTKRNVPRRLRSVHSGARKGVTATRALDPHSKAAKRKVSRK
jgi:4-hydroxy-2-oxoheptanedioate aldolase